jgi:glycosyltransferase involved in cell wall biosynthesis
MKISFLIGNLGPGGKQRQILYLISSLLGKCSIQLIIFSDNIFYENIYELPVNLIIIDKRNRYTPKTIYDVFKGLKAFAPDVVHIWDNISHSIALPYILTTNVKVVNGSIRYAGATKRKLPLQYIQKMAFATSHIIVSNSRAGLSVEGLLSNKKAKCIYNGFDIDFYKKNRRSIPQEIQVMINSFDYSVVMVGRFEPLKDYVTFIKSAILVIGVYPKSAFFCIGDGDDRQKAEKAAGSLLNKNIFFLGRRKDAQQIIHAFDIGVLLNNTHGHAEGISNVIMEYMAAGIPVIATNAGGTPELVRDQETGFLVPPFNPKKVSQKILYLLEHKQVRETIGAAGQQIIEHEFNLHKMATSYLSLYESI